MDHDDVKIGDEGWRDIRSFVAFVRASLPGGGGGTGWSSVRSAHSGFRMCWWAS